MIVIKRELSKVNRIRFELLLERKIISFQSFFQKCNYLKHYNQVHGEKTIYKCTQCSAQFTTKSSFDKHFESHVKPAQFVCSSCPKSFHKVKETTTKISQLI